MTGTGGGGDPAVKAIKTQREMSHPLASSGQLCLCECSERFWSKKKKKPDLVARDGHREGRQHIIATIHSESKINRPFIKQSLLTWSNPIVSLGLFLLFVYPCSSPYT